MLYGRETRCLNDEEVVILRRTEKAMPRVICGMKLMDRKSTSELMKMLGLTVFIKLAAKANELRWFGRVLRAEDNRVRMTLKFEVKEKKEEETK